MYCAVCGAAAPEIEHQFIKGNPEHPEHRWTIIAPLYFKSNPDNTAAIEGYCSANCAADALAY